MKDETHKMPDGTIMKNKDMPKKKRKSSGPNPWITHLKKVFSEGKKKDPKYKYKDAMKDAKSSYTKIKK